MEKLDHSALNCSRLVSLYFFSKTFLFLGEIQPKDFIGLSQTDEVSHRLMFLLNEADLEVCVSYQL